MARISFKCPHCRKNLNRTVDTPIVVEDEKATIHIKCMDGICIHCGRGIHTVFCAGVAPMTEHEVRKDGELFRMAERMRLKLRLPL